MLQIWGKNAKALFKYSLTCCHSLPFLPPTRSIRMTTQTLNFHLYPLKATSTKKSLSGFIAKISLLESELVCLLLSCSRANCTFLWCPSKKLINYRHLTTPHYKGRAAFAIREMGSHSNLAHRILFQQLTYVAYFFALSGSSLGYVVAGQTVSV